MRTRSLAAAFAVALVVTASARAQQLPSRARHPVDLVVLIAVDQLRGDYLDRWPGQLTGGLARIRDGGAFFPHALQDHAITETAPGHAAMLSGREPAHTEIVANARGVPDPSAPLIDAQGPGASPRRFAGTALYDWMLAHDPAARVLSVSRKDRGAILPVGRARGDVYWYADGRFTTSRYYRDTLPAWVRDWNAGLHLERLAGTRWTLLRDPSAYAEPDSVAQEHGGVDYVFPHVLPAAEQLRARITDYPAMDSLTLDFALAGVRTLALGRRSGGMPDLLSISLSTTDAVGHAYGPDSRELHDQILRLDHWLGAFLDALGREVPPSRMLLVLTSDHGVGALPELAVARTGHGGRLWLGDVATAAERTLEARYHTGFGIGFDNGIVTGDTSALAARGVSIDSLARALAGAGEGRAGVATAYTPRTLASAPAGDSAARRWRRTIPASLSWLAAFAPAPGFVWSPGKASAEHGTPVADDLHIPIAFVGAGIAAARYDAVVRSVDIAPTLAALLGIAPTEPLDGRAIDVVAGRTAARAP